MRSDQNLERVGLVMTKLLFLWEIYIKKKNYPFNLKFLLEKDILGRF